MDGLVEPVKDAAGNVLGIVKKPYDLEPVAVYALAKTRELIRPEVVAYESASQGKDVPAIERLACEKVEVDVCRLGIDRLKLGTNKIAPSVLCDLLPMLDGEL